MLLGFGSSVLNLSICFRMEACEDGYNWESLYSSTLYPFISLINKLLEELKAFSAQDKDSLLTNFSF